MRQVQHYYISSLEVCRGLPFLHEDEVFGACFVEGGRESRGHGNAFDVDGLEEVVVHCYCAGETDEHAFGGRWDPEGEAVHVCKIEVNG